MKKQTVHDRIKAIRMELGLSQEEFARELGVSSSLVTKYEVATAEPSENALQKIINRWGIDKNYLVKGEGALEIKNPIKNPENATEWKNEAFTEVRASNQHLEKEVAFYRQLLMQITGGKAVHFLQALNGAGLNNKRSLRAQAAA